MNSLVRNVAAAFTLGLVIGGPIGMAQAASSDHRTFDGKIAALSKINVKVTGMEGGKMQTISFLFKPPVGGKQTHDSSMLSSKALHVGEYVRVTYDQKLLGLRHADSVEPYADPSMNEKLGYLVGSIRRPKRPARPGVSCVRGHSVFQAGNE